MDDVRIDSMARAAMAFDSETHRIQPGLLAPPLVCGSIAALVDAVRGEILDRDQALDAFRRLLESPDSVLVGANVAFDLLVCAVEFAKRGTDVMPLIFAALEQHRVFDVQIAEALHAVAEGFLGKDPRTGAPLTDPDTGRPGRYSLSTCVDLVLGRVDAKANDEWRMRYAELDGVPMAEWPASATAYPIDDARNTVECALAQTGHMPSVGPHRWPSGAEARCLRCGKTPDQADGQCVAPARHRNLHDHAAQVATAFSMHLGAAWGFRVNQASVDVIERHALLTRSNGADEKFVEAGLLREDRTLNQAAVKRRVAIAYGAKDGCPTCSGTGKVMSPKAPLRGCPTCAPRVRKDGTWLREPSPDCPTCLGVGKIKNPNSKIACCEAELVPDAVGPHAIVKTKTCDGTGLLLPEDIPRTPKEGVGIGRDVLHESGDDLLCDFADWDEDKKDLTVYIPYLRKARACLFCGQPGTEKEPHACPQSQLAFMSKRYRDIPLTLRPNVILETGRTSYSGVIQLFRRASGRVHPDTGEYVPSLRECIEARPGYVLGSVDYEAGEIITHAQSCVWITGDSQLARALLKKVKPHNALAATMIGLSYEEFERRMKEGTKADKAACKAARQSAKPPNFGYPGGMSAPRLALQQRMQGPDTPHASGPNMVRTDDGSLVPGYKGLRFCILMDGAERCGGSGNMTTRWGRPGHERPIAPTCIACIRCAERLKEIWFRQWPENRPYFTFVQSCVQEGMLITEQMLGRWPRLRQVFQSGQRLAPGEIMQHVSGRIRQVIVGGKDSPFCSAANGFFQGLLADAAKSALRRVVRECYDNTVRVPTMAHANSLTSAYAGGPSPLLGSRVIVFQHDELLPEHPESVAHDAVTRTSEIMVDELRLYCPDLADACKAEPTLMPRWYKSAECVRDAQGRVIPWMPK